MNKTDISVQPQDSPCRECPKEKTCGTPCLKFDPWFRRRWRDVRTAIIVGVARAKSKG